MNELIKANKKWWNSITAVHAKSSLYDLNNFKKGKSTLQSTEVAEMGNVKGKSMLHLMCHFGLDTLSWARMGAEVTGVDISDESIRLATDLSKQLAIPAEFICSDIYDLPNIHKKQYDIIFMSYGVLQWLSDLKKWGKLLTTFLKPGGTFYIIEVHPFTTMLTVDFKLAYQYFNKGPYLDDSSGSYTDWDETTPGETYEWSYTVADVFNTLLQEKFAIEYFHEFPFTMYDQFPGFMKKNRKGQYVLKNKTIEVPLLFSLKATKRRT